jgi:hypothetical protein
MTPRFTHVLSSTGARLACVLLAGAIAAGCTDNPFEDGSTVQSSQRRISGTVRLSDRADHGGAYIWLEGFDLSTVSRMDGTFSLTLPVPSAQSTPGGNEGAFRLFAFLGNYRLQSVRTAVHRGTFSLPSTEVDEAGAIRSEVFLQQLFSITTTLSRNRIEADSARLLSLTVTLKSPVPPVEVYFPRMVDGIEGPLLLHNLGTGEIHVFRSTVTGVEVSDYVELGPVAYSRSMLLMIPKERLKAGEYEVIPYLLPRNANVPLPLLASLGTNVSAPGKNYAFYPFIRDGGRLIVDPN